MTDDQGRVREAEPGAGQPPADAWAAPETPPAPMPAAPQPPLAPPSPQMADATVPLPDPTPPASGAWAAPESPSGEPPAAPPSVAPSLAPPPAGPTYTWDQPVEPSGPAPGVKFAGHAGRLVAYIVDGIIVGVVSIAVIVIMSIFLGMAAVGDAELLAVLTTVVMVGAVLAISFGYFPYFWARKGATPGMDLFKLKLVRDKDGGPLTGGQAVLRYIGFYVSSFVFYLGFAWILIDSRRRGWHDLIAGTVMIERERE